MLITEDRLERALKSISHTDEQMGRLEGLCKGYKRQEKIIFAQAFLDVKGTSIEERKSKAYTTDLYMDFTQKYNINETEKDILGAKRVTEFTIVEVFRTESANQRRGNA